MPLPADNCGCRKLHPGVRRLEFADSDGAHISYELCGIANWRSRRGSKTHKDEKRLPEAASLALSNRSNFLTIGGFSFAICTTKRSVSSSTLGRPGERRNLDPSNLLAISLPYQPRMVSLRHYTRRCLECGRAREFRPLVQAQVANHQQGQSVRLQDFHLGVDAELVTACI
jgi:hypothetical protein